MAGILIDESALAEIRRQPCCLCGIVSADGNVHAHHIVKRGMGGGRRFDHRYNLLAVCWLCHERLDRMPQYLQFYLIAIREYLAGTEHNAAWYAQWVAQRVRERDRKAVDGE